MILQYLVQKLESITNMKAHVKDGNRQVPLEYEFSKYDLYHSSFNIYLHGNDMIKLTEMQNTIINAFVDLGDTPALIDAVNISYMGGGSFAKDNKITVVIYFNVLDNSFINR